MIYRFGIFEVDAAKAELRRKGLLLRIQDQPVRLLMALLEARGQILSKEQLRAQLWAQDIHVEVDGALSVAVAKLREALGDDAANPRFIETIPRRGYRFIAPIEVVAAAGPAVASSPSAERHSASGAGRLSRFLLVAIAALLLITAGFAAYRWMSVRTLDRAVHSLIITDFSNGTGDPVFDGSLRRAAIVQLSQSPSLHVDSDAAIDDALQTLNRPPAQGRVTPEMARQACQPLQAEAILSGSISRRGTDNYLISLEGDRCGDGERLSRVSAEVKGRDGVLGTLGQMLAEVREDLGEPRGTVRRFNIPVEQATTDSLEALNAYRVGYDLRSQGHSGESIPYFKAAIMLDPRFAMAYEQLGSVYSNMGEAKIGSSFVQKAFDLRERTTEPERYFISGRYFDVVTGEIEKALAIYSLWHSTYPREWTPLNALSNDLNLLGRYPAAIAAAQEAIRIEPHSFAYTNLAVALLGANRYAETEQICAEAKSKHRTTSIMKRVNFQLAFASGDPGRIRATTEGMKDDDNTFSLAEAALAQGKLKESEQLFAASAAQAHNAGLPGIEASDLSGEAIFLALIGESDEARRLARLSISDSAGELGYGQPMVVLAMLGKPEEAAEIGRRMDSAYPLSAYNMGVFRPILEGVLARRRGATAAKILETMAPAVPYELGQEAVLLPVYIRALLLAEAGDEPAAGKEFQHLLDNGGVDPTSPLLPLAHFGLARVHNSVHQTNESCTEYREFLREWKNADSDIPVLRAARSEAARVCSLVR
jgi:DNA-binding winged helix-turn-helix (wHTH) protein/tetratricopeptide (TPR) repeat protein